MVLINKCYFQGNCLHLLPKYVPFFYDWKSTVVRRKKISKPRGVVWPVENEEEKRLLAFANSFFPDFVLSLEKEKLKEFWVLKN